jgi:hypothetical protein
MQVLSLLGLLAALALIAAYPLAARLAAAFASRRNADAAGEFVAEVWLEWEICRGSTMYRERFASESRALSEVRKRARLLDWLLPTHYRSEDWFGRPTMERHEYEIRWGVRRITDQERIRGVHPVWSTELPGTEGYTGEHASAHPWAQTDPAALAHDAGWKV